jgi:hypothetical protein
MQAVLQRDDETPASLDHGMLVDEGSVGHARIQVLER